MNTLKTQLPIPVSQRLSSMSNQRKMENPTGAGKKQALRFPDCSRLMWKSALAYLLFASASLPPSVYPEATPAPASKDLFTVHSTYNLFVTPPGFPGYEKVKSCEELTKLLLLQQKGITCWGRGEPREEKQANWQPIGFTGVTGYYQIPGTADSITRGLEFRITFRDRTKSTVVADIDMNDPRTPPAAADNHIKVSATLQKNILQFIKVGPPQEDSQAWIALRADDFSAKATMLPLQSDIKM